MRSKNASDILRDLAPFIGAVPLAAAIAAAADAGAWNASLTIGVAVGCGAMLIGIAALAERSAHLSQYRFSGSSVDLMDETTETLEAALAEAARVAQNLSNRLERIEGEVSTVQDAVRRDIAAVSARETRLLSRAREIAREEVEHAIPRSPDPLLSSRRRGIADIGQWQWYLLYERRLEGRSWPLHTEIHGKSPGLLQLLEHPRPFAIEHAGSRQGSLSPFLVLLLAELVESGWLQESDLEKLRDVLRERG